MSLGNVMCQNLDVLTYRCDAELRVYGQAVRSLESAIGPEFAELQKRVYRALLAFEKARDQVSEHIGWHHCDAV